MGKAIYDELENFKISGKPFLKDKSLELFYCAKIIKESNFKICFSTFFSKNDKIILEKKLKIKFPFFIKIKKSYLPIESINRNDTEIKRNINFI